MMSDTDKKEEQPAETILGQYYRRIKTEVDIRFYFFIYSVINWFEATAMLLTLGQWSPSWVMNFAVWRTVRLAKERAKKEK